MDIIGIIWNYLAIIFTGDYKGHSTLNEDDAVWNAAYELRGMIDFVTTGVWTDPNTIPADWLYDLCTAAGNCGF